MKTRKAEKSECGITHHPGAMSASGPCVICGKHIEVIPQHTPTPLIRQGTKAERLEWEMKKYLPKEKWVNEIVRAVNARQRHIEALVRIKNMCEKQIVENPMGKTIAPEIHALVMKALDSYDVQDAISGADDE